MVLVDVEGRTLEAHCANPGRLLELLVPGRRVILEHSPGGGRKTEWTLAAVYFQGKVVSLISVRANRAAESLVLPTLFPGAEHIRAEYTEAESRFDFLVDYKGRREFVEVKNCTLSAEGRAMFPDAPTERGTRHLRHLQRLARGETGDSSARDSAARDSAAGDSAAGGSVLFILSHHDARRFTPNIHTDPTFAAALADTAGDIGIYAASLFCSPEGWCRLADPEVEIDLAPAAHARADRGSYLILARLEQERHAHTGALGPLRFPAGWYLYAGSARKGLSSRTARHLRRGRKRLRWHMDYLAELADELRSFPIRSGEDLECELAARFRDLSDGTVPRFGASDCGCESHLLYYRQNPLHRKEFFDTLLYFRHARITGGIT